MDLVTLRAAETVLSFSVFVGILWWAWGAGRKANFERLAQLPFDDTESEGMKQTTNGTEHDHG